MAHLRELWNDPAHCQTLYECPKTGTQWLRDVPFSFWPGGGPIILRKLPLQPDFSYYIKGQKDLACRCLAIKELSGDQAAEYAQFHLEEKSRNLKNCQIQFQCLITGFDWIMDFSFSRVPCGGMPVLTKMS